LRVYMWVKIKTKIPVFLVPLLLKRKQKR